ncbi:MAG: TonB-dependent receptor [Draconibacterium sp.]|nr:TonB-dependent receptor [Draconibacterium sp.]
MKTQLIKVFSLLFFIILSSQNVFAQEEGTVRGTVTDKNTGETLIGVNILIEGTMTGTVTDFDGNFNLLKLPSGTVNLVFSYISYASQTISEIEVKPGEVTILNVILAPATEEIGEVTITAKQLDNTENAILNMQRKAEGIQDGISSIEMKRYASSNAAESMTKVTGVSIVDGKNVVIRGLGDRYANVQLDGQNLPSTNPYKNSADIDLIPANLVDNIIVSKSFTPDQPGSFTGGNVNIKTKSFPETFTLNFTVGATYNTESSFKDNFLTHNGGKNDWLGFDDGTRGIPELIADEAFRDDVLSTKYNIRARKYPYDEDGNVVYETSIYKPTGEILGKKVSTASKTLQTQMSPGTKNSLMNHKMSFSLGNQVNFFGKPLGFIFGINYKRNYSFYQNSTNSMYAINSSVDENGEKEYFLLPGLELKDTRGVESPQISGLGSLAYKYSTNGAIEFVYSYSHDADKESRAQSGKNYFYDRNNIFQTYSINFTERQLDIFKTKIEHTFPKLNNARLELNGSIINTSQDVPDLRMFATYYNEENDQYYTNDSELRKPFHFWRFLDDKQYQGKADFILPFLTKKSASNKIKVGYFYSKKDRNYDEEQYNIVNDYADYGYFTSLTGFEGDINSYFATNNVGIVGTDPNKLTKYYKFGHLVKYESTPGSRNDNDYTGHEKFTAGYLMLTYNLTDDLKFIGGARIENTDMEAISNKYKVALENGEIPDSSLIAQIKETDILPSVNLVYALNNDMNLRASFSKTLARPNMREMAPFVSFSFIGGPTELGNTALKRTNISNYDLRWEWFMKPGELFAISGYYKDFTNPIIIQNMYGTDNYEIQYDNVEKGKVFGIELEFRKSLDFIRALKDFRFSSNLSITYSEISIDPTEFEVISDRNPDFTEPKRPFDGQSPYLINTNLFYSKKNFDAGLNYNKFGPRLDVVGVNGNPDVYEITKGNLDLITKYTLGNFVIGVNIKNLLNSPVKRVVKLQGVEYDVTNYKVGQFIDFTLSYNIN